MTLQSSGAISIADIQTEFGGANPAGMSEYYAGGSYVSSGTEGAGGAIPTSGTIAISDFYGAPSSWVASTWAYRSATASSPQHLYTPRCYCSILSNGYYRIYKYQDGSTTYTEYKWHVNAPGSFSTWDVTYVNSTGTVNYTNLTQSSWSSLNVTRYAGVQETQIGQTENAAFYMYIMDPDSTQSYRLMNLTADFT